MEFLSQAVGVVTDISIIGGFFVNLFAGGPQAALVRLVSAVQLLIQQQQQVLGLLVYTLALIQAPIDSHVVSNLHNIQSSVDYFNAMQEASWPQPYTNNFFTEVLNPQGLSYDLSVVYHNIMQDGLDLSPSLLTSFMNLVANNSTNLTKADTVIQTTYFLTRNIQFQIAGYSILMYASAVNNPNLTNVWLNTMIQRVQEQAIKSNFNFGSFYLGPLTHSFPALTDAAGYGNATEYSTIRTFTFNNILCYVSIVDTTIRTDCIEIDAPGTPVITWSDVNSTIPRAINTAPGYYTTPRTLVCNRQVYMHMISPPSNGDPNGDQIIFYHYIKGSGWTQFSSHYMSDYFPDYQSNNPFFYVNVDSICINNTIFLMGQALHYVNIYQVPAFNATPPIQWTLVGWSPLIDAVQGFNRPQYYDTIRLFEASGALLVGVRTCCDYTILRMRQYTGSPFQLEKAWLLQLFADGNGWINSSSYYTTIYPFVTNGNVYVVGRRDDGIHTVYAGPNDWNKIGVIVSNRAQEVDGPQWTDALGYNTSYQYLTAYSANNIAYLSNFNTTSFEVDGTNYTNWMTCAFVRNAWDCSANLDISVSAVPTSLLSDNTYGTFGVTQFGLNGGSLPVFYYRDSNGINTVVSNPYVMLTNINPISS
jgi:hypothetical protein